VTLAQMKKEEGEKSSGSDNRRMYIIVAVAYFVALVLIVFEVIGGGLKNIIYYVSGRYVLLLAAALVIFAEESLKSLRFVVAARLRGYRLSPFRALEAHFSSLFVGVLTPAFSGAVPTAAAVIGDSTRAPPSDALSIAMAATFADSMLPALASIYFALPEVPRSAIVVVIAVLVIVTWAVVLSSSLLERVMGGLAKFMGSSAASLVREETESFRRSLEGIVTSRRTVTLIVLISVTSYVIEALSLLVITRGGLAGFVRDFGALMMSYVGGNLPTPGGEVGVEYSLSLLLSGREAVLWRVAYIIVAMVPAVLISKIISSYVDYGSAVYSHYKSLLGAGRRQGQT